MSNERGNLSITILFFISIKKDAKITGNFVYLSFTVIELNLKLNS